MPYSGISLLQVGAPADTFHSDIGGFEDTSHCQPPESQMGLGGPSNLEGFSESRLVPPGLGSQLRGKCTLPECIQRRCQRGCSCWDVPQTTRRSESNSLCLQ